MGILELSPTRPARSATLPGSVSPGRDDRRNDTMSVVQTSRRSVQVDDVVMSVVHGGRGRPVVFVHGNPTSAQLWRNVLGHLNDGFGQCLAVDLIGMGSSAALPGTGDGPLPV